MKHEKIFLLIKIAIPVLIIGGSFGIDRFMSAEVENSSHKLVVMGKDSSTYAAADDKPLEISNKKSYGNVEGLSANFGFVNDDEALVGIGMSREEFKKKYPEKIKESNDNKNEMNDVFGTVYRLKLSNLEKISLGMNARDMSSNLLPGANRMIYAKDKQYLVYDLKDDSSTAYKKAGDMDDMGSMGIWSKDGNYLISYDNGDISLYNVKSKLSKRLKVKTDNLWVEVISGFYSEDGKDVYFIGGQSKNKNLRYKRQGIFKINSSSGSIQEIFVLPYNNDSREQDHSKYSGIPSNDYCILDGGKKIIFNGTIDGKDGTYIYDVSNKKFYNVVSHSVKSKEGSYASPIWVSPDKTKVIYMNRALENGKEQWNLYAANINGDRLTGKVCIYSNINISGSLDNSFRWSKDSKKILFFTHDKSVKENGFEFNDKNEINIITFK